MKLKNYIENLLLLSKENPDILEYEVIYSQDDEGNNYSTIHYAPVVGFYDNNEFDSYSETPNSICIN